MRQALADPHLLGGAMPGDTWKPWRTLLIALMGERLTPSERRLFRKLTGRRHEAGFRAEEFVAVIGRRGGKTFSAAVLLVYIAIMVDYSKVLTTGERGVALCIAQTQKTAAVAFRYASDIIEAVPLLKAMVIGRTLDSISLNNGVDLEVRPASFRGLRGITCVAVLADEVAFWMIEGAANPDVEILNALRPTLATTGGPLLIFSSPYAQRGELWELYQRHYGPKGDAAVLVAQATSREMNPALSQAVVERAIARDPAFASAEYLAQFRTDISNFLDRDVLRASVDDSVRVRPPLNGVAYTAFVDASSGRGDSFAAAVCHVEQDQRLVLDCLYEKKPPFAASATVAEVCALLKNYRVFEVQGDAYSIGFLESEFARSGVRYLACELDRSELFLSALPLFTSGRVRLLDHARLVDQFAQLERQAGVNGKDRVTHPKNGHDDCANAVAGALVIASTVRRMNLEYLQEQCRKVMALPPNPHRAHSANRFMRRPGFMAAYQSAMRPQGQKQFPSWALPPEKFEQRDQPSQFPFQQKEGSK
jgi:hypothetical protein